jgi:hypothetical protein
MIECIENPQAVTSLFGDGFDIADIDLHEVVVHRDGPSIKLRFDIAAVPATLPSRWPKAANTTQLVISAMTIDALQMSGFSTECRGVLRSYSDQGKHVLEFNGPGCLIRCRFSWLRIESVSGYVNVL